MDGETEAERSTAQKGVIAAAALVYVAVVLIVDTLATRGVDVPFNWDILKWQTEGGFDVSRFVLWFLVPLGLVLPTMDWGYFGIRRWHRMDWGVLAACVLVGAVAVLCITLFPSLRAVYGSQADASTEGKWYFLSFNFQWTLSYLVGWRFMHHYLLLRPLSQLWPKYGWLIIPVYEGVYHLQKPLIEAVGMFAASAVLTYWAVKRRNALLPFAAHLIIELELRVFQLFV